MERIQAEERESPRTRPAPGSDAAGVQGARAANPPLDPYTERLDRLLDPARLQRRAGAARRPSFPVEPDAPQTRDLRGYILSRVERTHALPSIPAITAKLDLALAEPRADARTVANVLQYDPALVAKLLGLVNSALFSLRHEVTRIEQAVAIVGVEAIRTLVLAASVFGAFGRERDGTFDPYEFWEHSVTVALGSRVIARSVISTSVAPDLDTDTAFLAGLLHDVGKIVIAQYFPEDHADILELAEEDHIASYDAELAVLGIRHTDIGQHLLDKWGLGGPLTRAVRFHHEPGSGGKLAYVVHLADLIARRLGVSTGVDRGPRFDPLLWTELGLLDEVIEGVGHQVLDGLADVRALFLSSLRT